jgi:ribosomal protein S18 acetylase RimI-like enzyme
MKLSFQSVEFIHIDALVALVAEFHACDRHPFTAETIKAIAELVNDDALGEVWLIYLDRPAGQGQAQGDRNVYDQHDLSNRLRHQSIGRSVNQPAQAADYDASNEAIGYVAITYGFSLTELRLATLDEIYLRSPYRGQGLGKQVLTFVEDYARSIGMKTMYLEVRHDHHAAQKLYQKMDYAEISERYPMYKRL